LPVRLVNHDPYLAPRCRRGVGYNILDTVQQLYSLLVFQTKIRYACVLGQTGSLKLERALLALKYILILFRF